MVEGKCTVRCRDSCKGQAMVHVSWHESIAWKKELFRVAMDVVFAWRSRMV